MVEKAELEHARMKVQQLKINRWIKKHLVNYLDQKISKFDQPMIPCSDCDFEAETEFGLSTHKGLKHRDKILLEDMIKIVMGSNKLYFNCKDLADELHVSRRHLNDVINDRLVDNEFIKKTKIKRKWIITKSETDWLDVINKINEPPNLMKTLSNELQDKISEYNAEHDNLTFRERTDQYEELHHRIKIETNFIQKEIYDLFTITGSAQYQMLKIKSYCDCLKEALDYAAPGTIYQYRSDSCEIHRLWLHRLKTDPNLKRNLLNWKPKKPVKPPRKKIEPPINEKPTVKIVEGNGLEKILVDYIRERGRAFYDVLLDNIAYYERIEIDTTLGRLTRNKVIVSELDKDNSCFYMISNGNGNSIDMSKPISETEIKQVGSDPKLLTKQKRKPKPKPKAEEKPKKQELDDIAKELYKLIRDHEEIDPDDLESYSGYKQSEIKHGIKQLLDRKLIESYKMNCSPGVYYTPSQGGENLA